jgi:hypothetical protein
MRMLHTWMRGGLLALGFAAVAVPAAAGDLYRWTTADGTLAFTDDAKRVPAAYRGEARRQQAGSLETFARYTPTDANAQARYTERLNERLAYLRAFNGEAPEEAAAGEATSGAVIDGIALRSLRRVAGRRLAGFHNGRPVYRRTSRTRVVNEAIPSLGLSIDPDDPSPVVMEERRVFDGDTGATRHVQVVQQGDRVLAVIKPRVHAGPISTGLEEDLER